MTTHKPTYFSNSFHVFNFSGLQVSLQCGAVEEMDIFCTPAMDVQLFRSQQVLLLPMHMHGWKCFCAHAV